MIKRKCSLRKLAKCAIDFIRDDRHVGFAHDYHAITNNKQQTTQVREILTSHTADLFQVHRIFIT